MRHITVFSESSLYSVRYSISMTASPQTGTDALRGFEMLERGSNILDRGNVIL